MHMNAYFFLTVILYCLSSAASVRCFILILNLQQKQNPTSVSRDEGGGDGRWRNPGVDGTAALTVPVGVCDGTLVSWALQHTHTRVMK